MRPLLAIVFAAQLFVDGTATCNGCTDAPIPQLPGWGMSYGAKGQPLIWTITGLAPGTYAVDLTFIETVYQTSGQRPLTVTLNDAPMLSGFDIFASGGYLSTVIRSAVVRVSDGRLIVSVRAASTSTGAHAAIISGIKVRPLLDLSE